VGIDHIVCGCERNIALNVRLKRTSGIPAHGSPRLPFRPRHARLYDVIKARTLAAAVTRGFSVSAAIP
jgi:hypothetical protein